MKLTVCHPEEPKATKDLQRGFFPFTLFRVRMTVITLLLATIFLPTHVIFAQVIPVCAGNPCTAAEVGVLMQDISGACGNTGTCTLGDIMQVFYNVGNWILGIVGAMVLLMYIWGGINILVGGASPERVGAGKKTIKTATLGLLIVFVAYAGITTLQQAFGGASGGGPSGTVACTQNTIGQACGDNMVCSELGCFSKCITQHVNDSGGPWSCTDVSSLDQQAVSDGCETSLCPGGDAIRCCNSAVLELYSTF